MIQMDHRNPTWGRPSAMSATRDRMSCLGIRKPPLSPSQTNPCLSPSQTNPCLSPSQTNPYQLRRKSITSHSWTNFKSEVMNRVGGERAYVALHLRTMEAQGGTLQWRCIIRNNQVFGVKANVAISTEKEFKAFVAEVVRNPSNDVVIRITMDDPGAQQKQAAAARAQDENLAL
ncbi:hypothetical protein PTTG_05884, partial [Puccinia triticina 1-1 BBBD Race 1]